MKRFICGMLVLLNSLCAHGQARPGKYPWSIKLKVLDDYNEPVAGADVRVEYDSPNKNPPVDTFRGWAVSGQTDTNGMFNASHSDHAWELAIHAQKSSYYSGLIQCKLYVPGQFPEVIVASNRNPSLSMILRKIGTPTPMFAKHEEAKLQQEDTSMGFDLMAAGQTHLN